MMAMFTQVFSFFGGGGGKQIVWRELGLGLESLC